MNVKKSSDFKSDYEQLMSLYPAKFSKDSDAIFFEAQAELLLQHCGDFGWKSSHDLIELLKFWSSLINANSFAIEVTKYKVRQLIERWNHMEFFFRKIY